MRHAPAKARAETGDPDVTTRSAEQATHDARMSTAIAIARLTGILGIIYVHAWTGRTGEALAGVAFSGQAILRTVLGEVFGRSAVPLLGMLSGWLVVSTAPRQP